VELSRGQTGKVAQYFLLHGGAFENATLRREQPVRAGSQRLRQSLTGVQTTAQSILGSCALSVAAFRVHSPKITPGVEDDVVHVLSAAFLASDFEQSRSLALTLGPKPVPLTQRFGGACRTASWMLLQFALLAVAAVVGAQLANDPGERRASLAAGLAAASLAPTLAILPLAAFFTWSCAYSYLNRRRRLPRAQAASRSSRTTQADDAYGGASRGTPPPPGLQQHFRLLYPSPSAGHAG
jgi:uncharacterized membrane protein YphA (DoxX/SURF4 family)